MKKIISFLIIICIVILSSCSNPSKPNTMYSRGENSYYKYNLLSRTEDDTYFIIEYEIEFKKEFENTMIECINMGNSTSFRGPEKIRIDNEEMEYNDNIVVTKMRFSLIIYENKYAFFEKNHFNTKYREYCSDYSIKINCDSHSSIIEFGFTYTVDSIPDDIKDDVITS